MLLNTLPPVPVASPRYSLLHACSSTPRRYSASSTKDPPSHSGWLSITSRYELCRTSVSARRSRSSFSRFTQLQSVRGGLYEWKIQKSSPRRGEFRMLRTASMPANWSSSSNQTTAQYPRVNFTPLSFSGSSAPRNTMRCPVGK